jgi:ABC-type Mn2+/Zn2+ transport system ATPase subunit
LQPPHVPALGGQQQRIASLGLVDDRRLLLLDEPLANLDMRNQREIVALLADLRAGAHVTVRWWPTTSTRCCRS